MKTFRDNTGKEWTLAITVAAVKRARDLLSVDLMGVSDGKLLDELLADPVRLCDVLYVLVKPQADAAGVSDVAFGEAQGGDAMGAAAKAFLEELTDFFRGAMPRKGRMLGAILKRVDELEEKALAIVTERIEGPLMEKRLTEAVAELDAQLGSSSGTAQGSSE